MSNLIRLATNENLLGPAPLALAAIAAALHEAHWYPGAEGDDLKHALAERLAVRAENISLDNGASGMIMALARNYAANGGEAVIPKPYFPLFESATKMHGGRCVFVPARGHAIDVEATLAALTPQTRLVFLTNPNNPTGLTFSAAEAEWFMARVPDHVLTIFDEAYAEYVDAPDFPDALAYVRQGRNVIVLRTFSKAFGLAGLRVGYGVAPKTVIERIVQNKYHVNSLSLRAARASLDDHAYVAEVQRLNREGRAQLTQVFDELDLDYLPTQGNFILIVNQPRSQALEAALLQHGVHVRATDKVFNWPQCVRVTIGTPAANAAFIAALRQVLPTLA